MRRVSSIHESGGVDSRSRAPSSFIRTYIVSNIRVYRDSLKNALENAHGMVVVGAGSPNGVALLEIVSTEAQVVLVDFNLGAGLISAKVIAELAVRPKVIAIGIGDDDEQVLECAEAGLSGYVPSDASLEDLHRVMHEAMENQFVCSPRVTAALVRKIAQLSTASHPAPGVLVSHLTSRQKQIAILLGQGLTNKEIGRRLSIRSTTVRNHVHFIFEKLNVKRRAEAVVVLQVNGSGRAAPSEPSRYLLDGTSA